MLPVYYAHNHFLKLIQTPKQFEVLGATANAIYIKHWNTVYSLICGDISQANPYTIVCTELPLECVLNTNRIQISTNRIQSVSKNISIRFETIKTQKVKHIESPVNKDLVLDVMETWLKNAPCGLPEVLSLQGNQNVCAQLLMLIDFLRQGDFHQLSEVLFDSIGYGLGLTPSYDDFVCGFLHGFKSFFSNEYQRCFSKNRFLILRKIKNKTTDVSFNFLILSLFSYCSSWQLDILNNLDAISCEKLDQLKHGYTSKADYVCGVYFLLKYLK